MTLEMPLRPVPEVLERASKVRRRMPPSDFLSGGVPIHAAPSTFSRRGIFTAVAGGGAGSAERRKLDPLLSLVHRITQGFNLAEYERARSLGYDAYLEEQLDPLSIDDSAMDMRLAGFTTLAMSPKQIIDNYPLDITEPYYQVKGAALQRSVFSKRQLFERMVEFWNDHFSLDHNKGDILYLFKPEDDRTVVRANALGTLPAILSASAHSGAMLFYLDNWLNYAGAIQENYARELLELHTMGVNGGYTEADIQEVARCLTGWTLNGDYLSSEYLRAKYEDAYHEGGQKMVLGNLVNANPPQHNLTRVLEILVAHPSTAQFISLKLIRWFLTETPEQALVDQVAQVFTNTGGDIKSMLRVILSLENVQRAAGRKFRRPFHLMASLLRGLNANVTDFYYPLFYLYSMGHSPFDWSPPNGYPDRVEVWGNSMLPRWRFLTDLMDGLVFGADVPFLATIQLIQAQTAAGLAQRIDQKILGQTLTPAEINLVQQFIDANGLGWQSVRQAIGLAASMPGYQWY